MLPDHLKAERALAAHLQRVLIVDPAPAFARLLGDLLKGMGGRHVWTETSTTAALGVCKNFEPQIIFCEFAGKGVDGVTFLKSLRRSNLASRTAPVVIVTSEATAAAIVASRNAGAHEFLRKPFTTRDLTRRIEAVFLRPRAWIEGINYIGPDRRRFNSGEYGGPRKRQSDAAELSVEARLHQSLSILKTATDAIESDPTQALRAMRAQCRELKAIAEELEDASLTAGAGELETSLEEAARSGVLSRSAVTARAAGLLARLAREPVDDKARAARSA